MNWRQWFCAHTHRHLKRDAAGDLRLVCECCGHVAPSIRRSFMERARIRSGPQAGEREAKRTPKVHQSSEKVTPMRARRG